MKHPRHVLVLPLLACWALASGAATNDLAQAVAADDAWQTAWVTHCRTVYATTGKTPGFVLQVGDSLTHATQYSQWIRAGANRSSADNAVRSWMKASDALSATPDDTANRNGMYLCSADTGANRGMTAAGGLETQEFISGDGNGGPAMPDASGAAALTTIADPAYTYNLRLSTMIAAFPDAQFAVLMLGTFDVGSASRTTAAFKTALGTIIDAFEAQHIVVVLSTIPPRYDVASYVARSADFSVAIREVAQARSLPLIDLEAEILARRPGTTWQGTLVDGNGYTLTNSFGALTSASDIYADGGDIATHRTGSAALNVGYLLRDWLTVQKLKEIKLAIVDQTSTGIELSGGGGTTTAGTTTGGTTTAGTTTGGTTTAGTTTAGTTAGGTTTGGTTTGGSTTGGSPTGCGAGGVIPAATGLALLLMLRRFRG